MEKNYSSLVEDYRKNGFLVVDDFLHEEVASKLESMFVEHKEWEFVEQYRDKKFGNDKKYGNSKTDSPYLPKEDEVYSTKFNRSAKLKKDIRKIFDQNFIAPLRQISGVHLTEFDIRCYKYDQGCYSRTHIDDWIGNISCLYYINKKWIWDWGGILHIGADDKHDTITTVFPKYNRAVFLDHESFRYPHFVSQITDYALSPRYAIVSFNK